MPELGPYGSVRGALSNERPYRDSGAPLASDITKVSAKVFSRARAWLLSSYQIATTAPLSFGA